MHLDIKPQNILVDENLDVKLADFGSAWLFHEEQDQISEVKGTSYFLAPESIYDPKKNQFGSTYFSGRMYDVWTLGITIYSLTFNCLPYKPASKGMSDITQAILQFSLDFGSINQIEDNTQKSSMFEDLTQRGDGKREISEGLKFFICKMLEKDPKKRATLAQLKKDVWLNQSDQTI